MKSADLKEKVLKAQAKVDKIKATIERHKKQAEKKLALIRKNDWNEKDRYSLEGTPQYNDSYWAVCEYDGKLNDIENAAAKLTAAETALFKWENKYKRQVEFENKMEKEMPDIFLQLKDHLALEWQQDDIKNRDRMKNLKKELEYEDFRKRFTYEKEFSLNKSDEEFLKIETDLAEIFILDLYNRVKKITGEVTDWGNIHYNGGVLNGWVYGINGKAKVRTIGAGGHTVQRYHLRVLVDEMK